MVRRCPIPQNDRACLLLTEIELKKIKKIHEKIIEIHEKNSRNFFFREFRENKFREFQFPLQKFLNLSFQIFKNF